MKVNITISGPVINGYTNLSPVGLDESYFGKIDDLNILCEDGECVELLCPEVMDYIQSDKVLNTLKHYVGKLRHGGRLIIGGTDLHTLCKMIVLKQINCVEANYILHGQQKHAWDFHYGQINLDDLVGLLTNLGLKIMKKRLNGYRFVVEAVRE